MPTSPWTNITKIIDIVMSLKPVPESVLDVGIGSGKYGFLCREYLSYWNSSEPRKITIHGVESFPDYVGKLQENIYDKIFIGNALEILLKTKSDSYDLILLIDVIEHFDKNAGFDLLRECQRVAKAVVVSTPTVFWPQGEAWGNPFEKHLCLWTKRDLQKSGACRILKEENWIAVFARHPYRERFTVRYFLWKIKEKFLKCLRIS